MKTIVVATDFSPSANQAAHFAAQLAHTQKATLILLNAYHIWPETPAESGLNFTLSVQAMHNESQQALMKLAHELRKENSDAILIRCMAKEGHTIPVIREVSREEKADLLIMSTVGSAPQSAQLMGSVATGMVAETSVPLLLIPPSAAYTDVRNVVLGIDLDTLPNAVALDTALRFAGQFGCVVNVLCVNNKPADSVVRSKAAHVRHLMGTVPHTLTIVSGKEIYETLMSFARTNKADLIMMLPQTHSWFRRLFTEGNTQRIARLTDIPVLAIV